MFYVIPTPRAVQKAGKGRYGHQLPETYFVELETVANELFPDLPVDMLVVVDYAPKGKKLDFSFPIERKSERPTFKVLHDLESIKHESPRKEIWSGSGFVFSGAAAAKNFYSIPLIIHYLSRSWVKAYWSAAQLYFSEMVGLKNYVEDRARDWIYHKHPVEELDPTRFREFLPSQPGVGFVVHTKRRASTTADLRAEATAIELLTLLPQWLVRLESLLEDQTEKLSALGQSSLQKSRGRRDKMFSQNIEFLSWIENVAITEGWFSPKLARDPVQRSRFNTNPNPTRLKAAAVK